MIETVIDGMKKEAKPFRNIMLFGYIFSILMPVSNYFTNIGRFSDKDIILCVISLFMIGSIGLYGWLYAIKYRVEFNNEKVYLKTLFKKMKLTYAT